MSETRFGVKENTIIEVMPYNINIVLIVLIANFYSSALSTALLISIT